MSSDLSILRLRTWVRSLTALVAERGQEESEIEQRHRTDAETCRREHGQEREQLERRHDTETGTAEADYRAEQTRAKAQFTSQQQHTRTARDVERENILEKGQHSESAARRKLEEAIWAAETVYEAKEGHPDKQYRQRCKDLKSSLDAMESTERQARAVLKRARQRPPAPTALDADEHGHADAATALDGHAAAARGRLDDLAGIALLRLFPDIIPFLLALLPGAAVVVIVGLIRGWDPDTVMLAGAGGGLALGIGVMVWLYLVARARTRAVYGALAESLQRGRLAYADALEQAEEQREREKVELVTTRDREVREAKEKYEPILEEINERREHHLARIREKYPALLKGIHKRREHEARESRQRYEAAMSSAKQDYERKSRDLETQHTEQAQSIETRYAEQWAALQAKWTQGVDWARTEADAINAESARLFPPWADPAWKNWTPRDVFAPAIRFGGLDLDMKALPGGLSADGRLDVGEPTRFDVPAMLALPDQCSLLLRSGDAGRAEAVQTLQTIMMRLLTAIPPGKVRFTIIDPIGEQRLADLTEHMENVIQKYLRNEYATIALYNDEAGEIAEPFRFVVVCDFPTNFSDGAARRLTSILSSGARCGVYALISMDARLDLPRGMALADLQRNSVTLEHEQGRFVWKDPDFEQLPLSVDPPPPESFVTEKLHLVGDAALDSTRVEVPFEVVVPDEDKMWSGDATTDVRVPLGRAGATRLQYLTLGQGTNQHALIAGKTGSGKSTMLHPGRVLPRGLQEGRRVQDLRHARPAARPGRGHRERSRVRSQRSAPSRPGAQATRQHLPGSGGAGPRRPPPGLRRRAHAPHAADHRRVPGVLRRGRQDRPGRRPAAGPSRAAGPRVRHPRAARLADAGRRVHAGPQHHRADGRADRAAVQRDGLVPHPQRRQRRGPAAVPARRSDLQRRQRPGRGQQPLPDRVAARAHPRALPPASRDRGPTARPPGGGAADRVRGQRARRPGRQPRARRSPARR
jgi:hypothetical protein